MFIKWRIGDNWKTKKDSHVSVDKEWGTGLKCYAVEKCRESAEIITPILVVETE